MGFFGFLFWMLVFWLAYKAIRGWVSCGRAYREDDWYLQRERKADRDSYVDALETRVSELEDRLDFTERLVAGRRE